MTIKNVDLTRTLVAMSEPTLSVHPCWYERWQMVCRIQWQDLQVMFRGWGVYVVLSIALLTMSLFLQNYLYFTQEQGLLVTSGTLNGPLYGIIFLTSLFLALSIIASVSHERTVGMITDLYGEPAGFFAYVVGKHLALMTTYLIMGVSYGYCLMILARLANVSLSPDLIWIGLVSILITSQVVALGIFLTMVYSRDQTARNLLLSIALVFITVQFGPEILANISSQGLYDHLTLSVQHNLASIQWIINWISPYAYLAQGIEAVMINNQAAYLTTLLRAALQTTLFLSLSIVTLQRQEGLK